MIKQVFTILLISLFCISKIPVVTIKNDLESEEETEMKKRNKIRPIKLKEEKATNYPLFILASSKIDNILMNWYKSQIKR